MIIYTLLCPKGGCNSKYHVWQHIFRGLSLNALIIRGGIVAPSVAYYWKFSRKQCFCEEKMKSLQFIRNEAMNCK